MTTAVVPETSTGTLPETNVVANRGVWHTVRYWLGNWKLTIGLILIIGLTAFSIIGSFLVDFDRTRVASGPFNAAPSAEYLFGTDNVGRDIWALMIHGIYPSLKVGLIAGVIGTAVGVVLGITAGYYGGTVDAVVSTTADIFLTIPSLLILIVLASYVRTTTIEFTALVIAIFAWAGPTRLMRSQTLSLRERAFIPLAKLSGQGDFEIAIRQILPNLLPYIMAGFVGAVSGAILALVGIQILGLGPLFTPNLGMILQAAYQGAAIFRGMWWWWLPPTVALMIIFISLFLISIALDELANPRLRERAK
ncbi:MAG TPA: ABC transporter permease [Caldilineaceae bacterium]|nr:ABC transporter permease [Caldilineaceae bacterium]